MAHLLEFEMAAETVYEPWNTRKTPHNFQSVDNWMAPFHLGSPTFNNLVNWNTPIWEAPVVDAFQAQQLSATYQREVVRDDEDITPRVSRRGRCRRAKLKAYEEFCETQPGEASSLEMALAKCNDMTRNDWWQHYNSLARNIRSSFYQSSKLEDEGPDGIRYKALRTSQDPASVGTFSPVLSPETSDTCDTEDEVDGECFDVRTKLGQFLSDATRESMLVGPVYNTRMRRDVRAFARIYGMGCVGLKGGCMLIDKSGTKLPVRPRKYRTEKISVECPPDYGDLMGLNTLQGYDSGMSSGSQASQSSRRSRQPKTAGGYPCLAESCSKVFDRACDLSHHQRNHRRKEERPHACTQCTMRFLHPKDLRRHERTHQENDNICTHGDEMEMVL